MGMEKGSGLNFAAGDNSVPGTSDYTDLSNKPSINGVTLTGNKSSEDLGITGASLFDIKTMANAIADKGWAFTCKSTRQDLAKADVPTVYNEILEKYNNADGSYDASYTMLGSSTGNGSYQSIASDDTYMYNAMLDNSNVLKRSLISSFPSTNWESTGISVYSSHDLPFKLEVGDNLVVTITSSTKVGIYKKSDFSEYKSITYTDEANIYLLTVNGKKTFYISYKLTENGTTIYSLAKIEDDVTADIVELRTDLTGIIGKPINDNGTIWFYYTGEQYICKTTDEFTTIINVQSCSGTGKRSMYKIGNTFVCSAYSRDTNSYISLDNGETWDYLKKNNSNISIDSVGWCDGRVFYGAIWDSGSNTHLYVSTDLENYTVVNATTDTDSGGSKFLYIPSINTVFFAYKNLFQTKYLGKTKTAYTDVINGTSVSYYKNGDYKICVADGGTNDTALATVYSYMGYYNYFVLDTTSETISLPRNSNLYSMMYVGDNYQDTATGITGNATRLLPQSEVISDSSATVSLDIKGNKDYQLTASALTSLTISSCEDSELGTTIKFNSGATATTINDSNSSGIEWVDGSAPTPSASKTCLIFIWNKIGFYKEW